MPQNSIKTIKKFKIAKKKFATITAYDYTSAKIIDSLDIPLILVGDSASMVVYGYNTTIPITMEEMLFVVSAVSRGVTKALVVADMPFMSYQSSIEKAIENAGAFIKNAGASAIKLEGGAEMSETISAIVNVGIPVVAHIGLTPQSFHQMSGYSIQGKTSKTAKKILSDARAVEEAGAFALVLEGIPSELAQKITSELSIPTIGIGAGPYCDGQIQVFHDILGLFDTFVPKHAKQFAQISEIMMKAIKHYKDEVESGNFPMKDHYTSIDKSVIEKL
tara:strand:+ start:5587 stop:6414 length:828 start_codon:yes stop_codon:yes gene_type:complete